MNQKILSVLVLAVLFLFQSNNSFGGGQLVEKCYPNQWKDVDSIQATVERVVDGDTIRFSFKGKIYNTRFLSIDTGETHFLGKSQGYWGDIAAKNLEKLLPIGTKVRIEFESERCDKYGRVLGHVWKGKTNINLQQVIDGMAVNYCIFPNIKYCAEYGAVVEKNIKNKKGVFSDPGFELPYEWRRLTSNRPHEKYIGDIETHYVYQPGSLDRVEIPERVFFMGSQDVAPPYHISE